MEKRIDTVIIGSGICGLSSAHFLSKQSNDFVVLEASNKIGGIIQTENKSEFICENGPNTVLLNNSHKDYNYTYFGFQTLEGHFVKDLIFVIVQQTSALGICTCGSCTRGVCGVHRNHMCMCNMYISYVLMTSRP